MRRLSLGLGLVVAAITALSLAIAAQASAIQYAYVTASEATGDVVGAPVTETGALGAPLSPAQATGFNNEALAFSPNGKVLFTNDDGGHLTGFPVASTGLLGAPVTTPGGSGYGLAPTPDGKFIYQAGGASTIYGFNLAADGSASTAIAGSPFPTTDDVAGIAITPDGKFLYTANNVDSTVGAFAIGADGALTELPGSPYPSAAFPYAVSLTPDGKHLYVPGRTGAPHQIYAYDIAANGALTPTPGSPFDQTAGVANSFGSTVTADGKYLFTTNFNSASLSGFAIAANGSLTQIAGSPFATVATSPSSVASDADGSHIYVTDGNADDIYAYSLAGNGVPTPVGGAVPIGATGDFQAVALTPAQPPVASLIAKQSGSSVAFDASGTTDDGNLTLAYDFGDGATQTTEAVKVSHKYKKAGTYTATVTVTDDEGCSITFKSSGQTAFCNGGPSARASTEVKVDGGKSGKPKLKLKANKKQKLGKPLKITVTSEQGVQLVTNKPKAKLKGASEKSVLYKPAKGPVRKSGKRKLKLKLSGKAARIARTAESGKVKVKVTASNNNGRVSKKVKIKLR